MPSIRCSNSGQRIKLLGLLREESNEKASDRHVIYLRAADQCCSGREPGPAPNPGPGREQGHSEISDCHLPTIVGGESAKGSANTRGSKGKPVSAQRSADAWAVPQQGRSSHCQQDV